MTIDVTEVIEVIEVTDTADGDNDVITGIIDVSDLVSNLPAATLRSIPTMADGREPGVWLRPWMLSSTWESR